MRKLKPGSHRACVQRLRGWTDRMGVEHSGIPRQRAIELLSEDD